MHKLFTTAVLLAAFSTPAQADMARYELDADHTAVYFTVDHIGYAKTLGVFTDLEGSFAYDQDTRDLSNVVVKIEARSVNTFHKARDRHVRNKDFLNVSNYPAITFTADGGTPKSATSGTVTGNLTILGQTRPITLDVKLNKAGSYPFGHRREVLGLSMSTTIERSAFGMDYGVANGLVGDEVTINIETEAMRMD